MYYLLSLDDHWAIEAMKINSDVFLKFPLDRQLNKEFIVLAICNQWKVYYLLEPHLQRDPHIIAVMNDMYWQPQEERRSL